MAVTAEVRPVPRPVARAGMLFGAILAGTLLALGPAAPEPRDNAADEPGPTFAQIARRAGEPQVPGLRIVYLHALGDPAAANKWTNIIAHQTEGPAGSARALASRQAKDPTRRGVTLWVETDGTVYWATAETAIPTHGDGANRNDNRYIDNSTTYRQVLKHNSLGVEFTGNHPDVRKPVTAEQMAAWLILVRVLQERYGIAADRIYAHNWIDFKDARYCEGCELAAAARKLAYVPGETVFKSDPDK
jgi:hypothetical protein